SSLQLSVTDHVDSGAFVLINSITPGTASRLFFTVPGHATQYMFLTANVIVFSAATAADEARTLTITATEAGSLVIRISVHKLRKLKAAEEAKGVPPQVAQCEEQQLGSSVAVAGSPFARSLYALKAFKAHISPTHPPIVEATARNSPSSAWPAPSR